MRSIKETPLGWNKAKYEVEVVHEGLGVYQIVKATDKHLLLERANTKMIMLDSRWKKQLKQQDSGDKSSLAENRTREAQNQLYSMDTILNGCDLSVPNINFDMLFKKVNFKDKTPIKQPYPPLPDYLTYPPEPHPDQFKTNVGCGCLTFLFSTKKQDAEKFQKAHKEWKQNHAEIEETNSILKELYKQQCLKLDTLFQLEFNKWTTKRKLYVNEIDTYNRSVRGLIDGYCSNKALIIGELFALILNNFDLPIWIPRFHRTLFNPENGILVVEGLLPAKEEVPSLESITYVRTRDEFVEKHMAVSKHNSLYDRVLYQIVLRSICEVFRWDIGKYVKAVVYNGNVKGLDQATGKTINPCILSIQASREEFEELNLKLVDPKECFKKLKGISSSTLFTHTPVAPVLRIDKDDRRFVEGRQVVDGISQGDNLASMDWEDFEHLIRELFEKEFAESGGEVKVTQASRDGGVDAIIFDPDPIRGGKIVVQAKRYTNTVGVSAVRDLYGTMMNEGANKGILVSTSDYGPDAYKFAKGKPLVLLNGGELLYLLEKHGHKARIDIKEAKMLFAEQDATLRNSKSRTNTSTSP